MDEFHFYHPIEVRYGDLDPQWHVNNTKFLAYMEQARFNYLLAAGLWDGKSFLDLGLIVADAHVSFKAPIELGQKIRVGVKVGHVGTKSLRFDYQIEDVDAGQILATGETTMVAFDYHTHTSIPVSEPWKQKISALEGRLPD
jgi:acyl-CoA thioester hydrolase